MNDITRIETKTLASRGMIFKGMASVADAAAHDRSQDIPGQTQEALVKVEKYLALAGAHKTSLPSEQIWLKDIQKNSQL